MECSRCVIIMLSVLGGITSALADGSGPEPTKSSNELPQTNLYVSPSGNNSWNCTSPVISSPNGPCATLQGAQRVIRAYGGALPAGGIVVNIMGGTYRQTSSFSLSSADFGTPSAPIVWKAYENQYVAISGAQLLSGWVTTTNRNNPTIYARLPTGAQGHVVQTNLSSLGLRAGSLAFRGVSSWGNVISPAELIWNDTVEALARWPATGFTTISSSINSTHFVFSGTPDNSWSSETDIWVLCYCNYGWSPNRISATVGKDKTATLSSTSQNVYISGIVTTPIGLYFENILAEITQGTYYIDRSTNILYFWPPAAISSGVTELSQLATPLVDINGASNISLDGIVFENVESSAIFVSNSTNIRIANSTIRNTGEQGVLISNSTNSGVTWSEIYATGEDAIVLASGLPISVSSVATATAMAGVTTLADSGLYANNNYLHDYARWDRTYRAGVAFYGVGGSATNNLMSSSPHSAVLLHGQNHTVMYNEFNNNVYEAADSGVIYGGGEADRGNVVKFNYFHDVLPNANLRSAIYEDQLGAGITIFGNVFCNIGYMGDTITVFLNGGRNNVVQNNVFVNANYTMEIADINTPQNVIFLTKNLGYFPYQNNWWSIAYPTLLNILNDTSAAPFDNVLQYNVSAGTATDNFSTLTTDDLARTTGCATCGNSPGTEWASQSPTWINVGEMAAVVARTAACPAIVDWAMSPPENGFVSLPLTKIGLGAR